MRARRDVKSRCALALCLLVGSMAAGCDDGEAEPMTDAAPGPASDMANAPDPDAGLDPAEAVAELEAAVDLTRYAADLEFVARGPRPSPDGANWQATQDLCADVFVAAGLEVVRQPFRDGGVNVVGRLPGLTRPDEQIVIGAHYDSEFGCDGADDNASGVAGVLEAARALGGRRFERTLVFVCFDAEEYHLRGALDFAARAREAGDDIRGALVLEMIGYRDTRPGSQALPESLGLAFPDAAAAVAAREDRADFLFYAADDDPEMLPLLEAAAEAADLPLVGVRLDAVLRASELTGTFRRSDHAPLWDAGFPAMMLTDTAEYRNPNYHCGLGEDDIDTIDMEFAATVTRAVVGAAARAAVPIDGEPVMGRTLDPAPVRDVSPACDAVDGSCPDGQRCAFTVVGERVLRCVPPAAEPLGVDAPCERAADGGDQCDAGLFCTLTGRAIGDQRRCRPLCYSAADCAEGEACPDLRGEASNCVEGCDPLGDDCPPNTGCGYSGDTSGDGDGLFCRQAGPQGEGEPCDAADCLPGLTCASRLSLGAGMGCLAWCRISAPTCGEGRVCWRLVGRGLPEDYGLCVPADRVEP